MTLAVSPEPNLQTRRIVLTLVPGGTVEIPEKVVPSAGAAYVLSLTTGRLDAVFVDRDRVIPFPAGETFAVALQGPGQFLGATKPFAVERNKATELPRYYRPKPGTGIGIVGINYPAGAGSDQKDLRLAAGGSPADLSVLSLPADTHYFVFYDLPRGRLPLTLESRYWRLGERSLDITSGRVSLDRNTTVTSRPSLFMTIAGDLPAKTPVRITILDCEQGQFETGKGYWPDATRCSEFWKGEATEATAVHHMGPRWYFVVAEADGERLGKRVDFRAGQDRTEVFRFVRSRVFGQVYRGKKGVPAAIRVEENDTGRLEAETQSGSDGSYEVRLWAPKWVAAHIRPLDREESDSFIVRFEVRADLEKDFVVPDTDVRVLLRDAETRQPLAGRVSFTQAGASAEREAADDGEARLPPLGPGLFKCEVSSEGHKPEVREFVIADQPEAQSFTVFLKPLREENSFLAILPTGIPAGAADVFVGSYGSTFREHGRCAENGWCRLAEDPPDEELLFVFHRDSGLTVARAGDVLGSRELYLRPPGGMLKVLPQRGARAANASLELRVGLDGVQLPPFLFAVMGTRLSTVHRYNLPPGFHEFEIPGLPAGIAVLSVVARPLGSPSSHPAEVLLAGREVMLPAIGPVLIPLP